MMGLIKFSCLLLYAMALAGWTGMWTGPAAATTQIVALLILGVHVIEVFIAFKLVRRYPGSLATSVVLTLLFGLLHLRPLEQQARRMARSDKEVGSHGVGKD
ncbi:hypothetical protein [Noviherbaspirillum sp.]|uniref:hypothetical protein n=1 Tax=Noviherbaspirillum sp. TaxID=1926288 RepID=UPI002D6413EA|nr:hypothetical protein [Noviherbaspirillum sp.]HZW19761.1 hypothetical protein [Noviherbaspirillum sp.]